mmetsp:Transcript_76136/g.154590  ORF Transcript_76136/g.154590 Transcript_76136/m.154590 type:complete len:165 (+) Transcript_76136:77-571(+)
MVVLEAAALSAAGYGLYKGGEAGVNKGKECHREFQREKKRTSQRSVLSQKTKSRSERIAEIVKMKHPGGLDVVGAPTTGLSRFGFGGATTEATNKTIPNNTVGIREDTTEVGRFAARQIAEKEASSDVDDRHRNVMNKLKSSRRDESKKGMNSKLRLLNPFKKK